MMDQQSQSNESTPKLDSADFAYRYFKAVEVLGAVRRCSSSDRAEAWEPDIEARIGAIRGLELLAKDSEKDQLAIMATLCGYLKHNAKWEGEPPLKPVRPRADIQAVFNVFEDRTFHPKDWSLNLSGVDLRHLDLELVNLESAHLFRARFDGANLRRAHLQGADLSHASMKGANLIEAALKGAWLCDTDLEDADLTGAGLDQSECPRANLRGAKLSEAWLEDASLLGAELREARGVTQEQIDSTWHDARTLLPDGIVNRAEGQPEEICWSGEIRKLAYWISGEPIDGMPPKPLPTIGGVAE